MATLLAHSASATTFVYVDWVSGSDTAGDGSSGNPYKTIKKGLSTVANSSGYTISVAGGSSAIYEYDSTLSDSEAFPLTAPFDNVTIRGTGTPMPTIKCDKYQSLFASSATAAAIRVDTHTGWRIERVRIDNFLYIKSTSGNANLIRGIHVLDLPSGGTIHIQECEISECFYGVILEDAPMASAPTATRSITIDDTLIEECGPNNAFGSDMGHAGVRLLEMDPVLTEIDLTDCTLRKNHDALEPGKVVTRVVRCLFDENENGLELASIDGGDVTVTESCFRKNGVFDPAVGGANAARTAGLNLRTVTNLARLKVRSTEFDNNQIGVWLRDGTVQSAGAIDFGTSFSTPDLGRNTFTTDTTAPWYTGQDYNVSYCGFINGMEAEAQCVGNIWTYVSPLTDPNNQGANSLGRFPAGSTLIVPPGTNLESISINFPPHRPLAGSSDPQVPWNFSTRVELENPPGTGTGFPSILLVQ